MVTGTSIYQELFQGLLAEGAFYNGRNALVPITKLTGDSTVIIDENGVRELESVRLVKSADSPDIDAFGRRRISEPITIFETKQLFDNQPLLWDDARASGTGTASIYSSAQASTRISVSGSVAGTRVRQTFRRFNYQPAKSQLVFMTWGEFDTAAGITKRVGYFDQNNGLFFQSSSGTVSVVQRSSVSGSAINTTVNQSDWNLDKMNGGGKSGINLDFAKVQIGIIDFEWLGAGRVRMGFVIGGLIYYCHEFLNANQFETVYMSTPVLPLRYEISNDGSGAADGFVAICSSVSSEGGQDRTGLVRHKHNIGVSSLATGNEYAILGIRLNPAKLGAAELVSISIASTTQGDTGHWMMVMNPIVSGTFSYVSQENSIVQVALGTSANTLTGGIDLDGGFFSTSAPRTELIKSEAKLGAYIDGTPTTFVLSLIPLTNNLTISASIEWREL